MGQWNPAFWFPALTPSNIVRTLLAPTPHISLTFPRSPQEHPSPFHLHGGTRVPQRHWGKSLLLVMFPAASTQGPAPQAEGQGQPVRGRDIWAFVAAVLRLPVWSSPALPPGVYPGGLGSTALESFPITSIILISSIWIQRNHIWPLTVSGQSCLWYSSQMAVRDFRGTVSGSEDTFSECSWNGGGRQEPLVQGD